MQHVHVLWTCVRSFWSENSIWSLQVNVFDWVINKSMFEADKNEFDGIQGPIQLLLINLLNMPKSQICTT